MDGALGRAQRLKSVLDRGAGTVHTDVTAPYTGVQNAGRAIEENIDAVKAIYAKWSQYPPYESNSQGPTFARVFPEVEAALNRIKNGEPPITSFSPRNNFEARQPWRGAVLTLIAIKPRSINFGITQTDEELRRSRILETWELMCWPIFRNRRRTLPNMLISPRQVIRLSL